MYRRKWKDLNMVFIDLEKVYDGVLREVLQKVWVKKGVWVAYIHVIHDIIVGSKPAGEHIVGLCRGFPLFKPMLDHELWSFYLGFGCSYSNYLGTSASVHVFCKWGSHTESQMGITSKQELCREALSSLNFRLSGSKTEYMEYKFSHMCISTGLEMKLGDHNMSHIG